ncbi:hypothetical protein [Kaarinaea lacus]
MNIRDNMLRTGIKIFILCFCGAVWLVQAGEITYPDNSFGSGDTLNASDLNDKFNEIKTQVNDNNARTTTNASDISNNATDISGVDNALADLAVISALFAGDGSAGTLNITANSNWVSSNPANINFTDCSIAAGFTLMVSAGTVIRCTGDFTNDGTITVAPAGNNSVFGLHSQGSYSMRSPGAGDAYSPAGQPGFSRDFVTTPITLVGGAESVGIPQSVAVSSWNRFRIGGSAGSAHQSGSSGSGGGLVKILVRGAIINNGQISADGVSGSQGGGGGGGIVVVASLTSVTNASGATIEANGGAGSSFQANNGAAGGGGGGIVVMIAPTIDNSGTVSVTGGSAGASDPTAGAVNIAQSSGGGGGGACGGNGGTGGSVASTGEANAASAGSDGYVIELTANPATML